MRILIIRHADPDYTHDTLTEKGWREAELLANRLEKEKIDYFYSSPLGRAKDTCKTVAKRFGKEKDIVVHDWLREFDARPHVPCNDRPTRAWDILPQFWTDRDLLYDSKRWHQEEYFKKVQTEEKYQAVGEGLKNLLASHGYVRENGRYRVENANSDTIALFCHFGIEMMILSLMLGVSPIPLLHGFVALPSSVTTLYSEERREGVGFFRCCEFGSLTHLYIGNEPPSFAARFCERFIDETRHD